MSDIVEVNPEPCPHGQNAAHEICACWCFDREAICGACSFPARIHGEEPDMKCPDQYAIDAYERETKGGT